MDESKPVQTKTKMQQEQERLASSSFNVEEWKTYKLEFKADKELAQRLQAKERECTTKRTSKNACRAYQSEKKHMGGYTLQQLRGYSFDEIKNLLKHNERVRHFVPIESRIEREIPELAAEVQKEMQKKNLIKKVLRGKRLVKAQNQLKNQKIKKKNCIRKYWKIIRVGNHTEVHQFFDDILKDLDMDDLVMLWSLVKENFKSTEPTDDKEREIWVELKRLSEPDTDDELWKLQNHIHDLTWRLYDSCGVHHVSTEKGIDIYMLVEKEYPLSRGTLTQMLVAKLLVDQDNKISRELLRKICQGSVVERP
ncbi:hypothetical protein Tco_0697171 [Tanacetum coccineum]